MAYFRYWCLANLCLKYTLICNIIKKKLRIYSKSFRCKILFCFGYWFIWESKKYLRSTQLKNIYPLQVSKEIYNWEAFLEIRKNTNLEALITTLKAAIQPAGLATIIYTSSTKGTPKGMMFSHNNVVDDIFKTQKALNLVDNKKRIISCLSISHIFERFTSY